MKRRLAKEDWNYRAERNNGWPLPGQSSKDPQLWVNFITKLIYIQKQFPDCLWWGNQLIGCTHRRTYYGLFEESLCRPHFPLHCPSIGHNCGRRYHLCVGQRWSGRGGNAFTIVGKTRLFHILLINKFKQNICRKICRTLAFTTSTWRWVGWIIGGEGCWKGQKGGGGIDGNGVEGSGQMLRRPFMPTIIN